MDPIRSKSVQTTMERRDEAKRPGTVAVQRPRKVNFQRSEVELHSTARPVWLTMAPTHSLY